MEESIILLPRDLDRSTFTCSNSHLTRYFQEQAGLEMDKNVGTCFILTDGHAIKGYYTLSANGIARDAIPEAVQKKLKLPRYLDGVPVILLGRLAIDEKYTRKGFGELLLMDAFRRAAEVSRSAVAAVAVIVDPIDGTAVSFYEKYDFIQLPGSGKMFLPMKTIAKLFSPK